MSPLPLSKLNTGGLRCAQCCRYWNLKIPKLPHSRFKNTAAMPRLGLRLSVRQSLTNGVLWKWLNVHCTVLRSTLYAIDKF